MKTGFIISIFLYLIDLSEYDNYPFYLIISPMISGFIHRVRVIIICNFLAIEYNITILKNDEL